MTMKSIPLSHQHAEYLRDRAMAAGIGAEWLLRTPDSDPPDKEVVLAIDQGRLEQLRCALTKRLASLGFDERYELNDEGRLLEELIDALFLPPDASSE